MCGPPEKQLHFSGGPHIFWRLSTLFLHFIPLLSEILNLMTLLKLRRISTGFLLVTGGSGYQAVKLRVPGELVGEGDDGAAHPDQTVTGLGAGDVP